MITTDMFEKWGRIMDENRALRAENLEHPRSNLQHISVPLQSVWMILVRMLLLM